MQPGAPLSASGNPPALSAGRNLGWRRPSGNESTLRLAILSSIRGNTYVFVRMVQRQVSKTAARAIETLTAASRTRPWLAGGWGCRGRHLSIVRENPGRRRGPRRCRPIACARGPGLSAPASRLVHSARRQGDRESSGTLLRLRCSAALPHKLRRVSKQGRARN